jgi:hypothetical protein
MKYDIVDGQTVNTSVLYEGQARFATISPDGQKVAFIIKTTSSALWELSPASIAVIDAAGGEPDILVPDIIDGFRRCFLDWPEGDWLYYGRGRESTSNEHNDVQSLKGITEIWKINVNTRENIKVISFSPSSLYMAMWQIELSNNATRGAVRPLWDDPVRPDNNDFVQRITLPNETISPEKDDENSYGRGCATGISPDGAYLMALANMAHSAIRFFHWEGTEIEVIPVSTMASWGSFFGRGTDNNRWSSNHPNWIVLCCGLEGRGGGGGSNQALINWIDGEVIRTSDASDGEQNETGDFWVQDAPPLFNMLRVPEKETSQAFRVIMFPDFSAPNLQIQDCDRIWDISGRRHFPQGTDSVLPGVSIMERRITSPQSNTEKD